MMLRYTFDRGGRRERIEAAVKRVLRQGLRTADIYEAGMQKVGTAKWVMRWWRHCMRAW